MIVIEKKALSQSKKRDRDSVERVQLKVLSNFEVKRLYMNNDNI